MFREPLGKSYSRLKFWVLYFGLYTLQVDNTLVVSHLKDDKKCHPSNDLYMLFILFPTMKNKLLKYELL